MFESSYAASSRAVDQFMYKVYAWMFAGLMASAAMAFYLLSNPPLLAFLLKPAGFIPVVILQFGLVIYLSARITAMHYTSAVGSFLAYSVLTGIMLAPIALVYTASSIYLTFAVTAGMFGVMAIYGYVTKTDLSSFGNILFMGLIGLIISSLANIYFQSEQMDYIISFFGVAIFTALTAYDVQRIKHMAAQTTMYADEESIGMSNKVAILGALILYLDFINLFLYLLRFMGKKRD